MKTRIAARLQQLCASLRPSASTRSFSISPLTPLVPESRPPWPGSSTTTFLPPPGGGACWRGDQRRQLLGVAFALLEVGRPAGLGVEFGAGGGEQVDHHPVAEAGGGRDHQRVGHRHRLVEVDHHARIAGAEQAIAIGFDGAEAAGPRRRAQPPGHFRHVDHHPVGIGQGEGAQIHRIGQFDHQPGAVLMLADARAHHHGQRPLRPGAHRRVRRPLGGERPGRRDRQASWRPRPELGCISRLMASSAPSGRQDRRARTGPRRQRSGRQQRRKDASPN